MWRFLLLLALATAGLCSTAYPTLPDMAVDEQQQAKQRYLAVLPSATDGFNIQRRCMYGAIALAKVLDRILCMPEWFGTNEYTGDIIPMYSGDELDVPVLSRMTRHFACTSFKMDTTHVVTGSELRYFTNESAIDELGSVEKDAIFIRHTVGDWDFGAMKQSGKSAALKAEDAPLFGIARSVLESKLWPGFVDAYEAVETEEFGWIRNHVICGSHIRRYINDLLGERWRIMKFGSNGFVGVHILSTPNERWSNASTTCPVCCMAKDPKYYAKRVAALAKKFGTTDVVLSVDAKAEIEYDTIIAKGGLRVFFLPHASHNSITQQLFEQEVLARSSAFIGSLCSAYSIAVYEQRLYDKHLDADKNFWW